ncbi:MAG: conjugal transfer relaxase/helicase TraA, partial [Chlamydiia bacterium]|nr:conjugal transfer relaxase/helicase TraA [Chlamydiia bacterium]
THTREVEGHLFSKKREETLQALKESEHFSNRLKGTVFKLWDRFNQKIYAYLEKKQDRKPDQSFFDFKDERDLEKASVREVSKENLTIVPAKASEKISPQEIAKKVSKSDQTIEINKETIKMRRVKKEIERDLYDQNSHPGDPSKSFEKSPLTWKDFSKEERKQISSYFAAASKAQELREVVQAECGESLENVSKSSHYQEWQKACALRNESAYQLKPLLSKEEHQTILKEKTLYYIEIHAKKHEEILKIQEQKALQTEKIKSLDGQLSFHIEPLLYKLFSDGPSSKNSQSYRFGAKGSLSVTYSGPKAGQFYDFERQEGGTLLKLIARELKLDKHEAKTWAGEFLGIASEIRLPTSYKKIETSKESNWTSLKPDSHVPPPKFEEIGKLHHYYKEVARHPYRDLNGNLLYYVLRLENDKGQKITPPLSYGRFEDQNPSWELKGYTPQGEKRPLYNLHHLKEKPLAEVLIVEGEKTADKALEKFSESHYVCLTWSGGASSVSKTDWSPLHGKEVKIWPDNDEAGWKGTQEVLDELKKVGVKKVRLPERGNLFEKLPPKWDLADPLPQGVTTSSLHRAFSYSNKNHFQESVLRRLGLDRPTPSLEKTKAIDLLYAYEKTHKQRLEGEFPKEISLNQRDTIQYKQQHEGVLFLNKEKEILQKVKEDTHINASGEVAERLTHQIHLFEAKTGKEATLTEILTLKETIESFPYETIKCPQEVKEIALYKALSYSCEKALIGEEVDRKEINEISLKSERECDQQKELERSQERALQKQQELQRSKGPDLSL